MVGQKPFESWEPGLVLVDVAVTWQHAFLANSAENYLTLHPFS